jgi:hypothetical protein
LVPLEPLIRKLETESQLGDDEREAVRQLPFTVRNIPAGGDIVRERENPSQCCLVLEGWLCRHKITLGGARQIFSFHIAGDIPDLQSLHLTTMDHTLNTDQPDGSAIALPPDPELRADLCAPTWKLGTRGILLESKDGSSGFGNLRQRLGRSPGKGDAVVMAWSEGNEAAVSRHNAWKWEKHRDRPQRWIV